MPRVFLTRRVALSSHEALALQFEQVREHAFASHRDQRLVQAAIEPRDDRIWTAWTFPKQADDLLLALLAMFEIPTQHGVGVVDNWTVRGQQSRRPQCQHALERGQVGDQIALQIRRNVDRCALLRQIASEHRQ